MQRLTIALAAVVGASLLLACRRDSNPPPQAVEGGAVGVPIRVSARAGDDSILGSVRSEDQPLAPASPGQAVAAPVDVDMSSPEAVAEAYRRFLGDGQFAQLPALYAPDQQEAARLVVVPSVEGGARLMNAYQNAFPDHEMSMKSGDGGEMSMGELEDMLEHMRADRVEVQSQGADADEAQGLLLNADGEEVGTINLARVDDRWYLVDEQLPSGPELEQARPMLEAMGKMGQALSEIASRIESGELATPEQADAAVAKSMEEMMGALMGAMMQGMGEAMGEGMGEGALAIPSEGEFEFEEEEEEEAETPEPATERPEEPEREAVDEVFSSPVLAR